MKGMKGKLLKTLKSMGKMASLKQPGRVLQVSASDGFMDPFPPDSGQNVTSPLNAETPQSKTDVIDLAELLRELGEDEESEQENSSIDKENIRPPATTRAPAHVKEKSEPGPRSIHQSPLLEIGKTSFRRPELNSSSLFDPDLLAQFQQAVTDHQCAIDSHTRASREASSNPEDPLMAYEERCPPGGENTVVLYTTSIRGIRKTFEDCSRIKFLLGSLKVLHSERDVSMHLGYREELWEALGGRVVPPRLFIRGRYIGGADEVLGLHEQGRLVRLLEGIHVHDRSDGECKNCRGVRFLLCSECSGSCKRVGLENDGFPVSRCLSCNENGLIVCPRCY